MAGLVGAFAVHAEIQQAIGATLADSLPLFSPTGNGDRVRAQSLDGATAGVPTAGFPAC